MFNNMLNNLVVFDEQEFNEAHACYKKIVKIQDEVFNQETLDNVYNVLQLLDAFTLEDIDDEELKLLARVKTIYLVGYLDGKTTAKGA